MVTMMIPPGIQDRRAMPLHVKVELFRSGIFENRRVTSLFRAIFEIVRSTKSISINIRNEFNVFRNRINEMIKYHVIFQYDARALK
jgi:hypothetical protein